MKKLFLSISRGVRKYLSEHVLRVVDVCFAAEKKQSSLESKLFKSKIISWACKWNNFGSAIIGITEKHRGNCSRYVISFKSNIRQIISSSLLIAFIFSLIATIILNKESFMTLMMYKKWEAGLYWIEMSKETFPNEPLWAHGVDVFIYCGKYVLRKMENSAPNLAQIKQKRSVVCWTCAKRAIFTIKKIFTQRTSRKNICDFSGFSIEG